MFVSEMELFVVKIVDAKDVTTQSPIRHWSMRYVKPPKISIHKPLKVDLWRSNAVTKQCVLQRGVPVQKITVKKITVNVSKMDYLALHSASVKTVTTKNVTLNLKWPVSCSKKVVERRKRLSSKLTKIMPSK